MAVTARIDEMIAAAKALGAPDFGLAHLRNGAARVEVGIADFQTKAEGSDNLFLRFSVPEELAADLAAIERGAEAAFAFVCCRHLPADLGLYRERADANDLIIQGYRAAERHGAVRWED